MSRTIDSNTKSALLASEVTPVFLFEAEYDEGAVRFWTGFGDLLWNGYTWLGTGVFGSVSDIEESTNVQANGVTVSLSGIPSEIISIAFNYNYQGRPCRVYLGAVSTATPNQLVGDPLIEMGGRMDVMSVEDSGDTGVVSVSIENRLIDLSRAKERRYTHEDQLINYPGDLGLEYVAGLQDKEVPWGVASSRASTSSSSTAKQSPFRR
jgi:hypothetical protein